MRVQRRRGLRLAARWRALNGPFRFGLFLTALVLGFIVALAFGTDKEANLPRWKAFWHASPNEIGDTIAGIAGTLAFLWIIVTVMIQGNELRLQRRELAMTRRELKAQREASEKMAIAQDAQVRALEAQAVIFEDENLRRNEERMKEILDGLLNTLRGFLQNSFSSGCSWTYVQTIFPDGHEQTRRSSLFHNKESRIASIDLPEVDFFHQILVRLKGLLEIVAHSDAKGQIRERPAKSDFLPLERTLLLIEELNERLSLGQKYRLAAIGFEDLKATVDALSDRAGVASRESSDK